MHRLTGYATEEGTRETQPNRLCYAKHIRKGELRYEKMYLVHRYL